jgi:ethanolamine utilization protein EutQ
LAGDCNQVCLPDDSILTPSAKDFAAKAGLTVTRGNVEVMAPSASSANFKRQSKDAKSANQGEKETCATPSAIDCVSDSMIKDVVQKVMDGMMKPACENPRFTHIFHDDIIIGPFDKAPAGQNIKMTDVVTAREANLAAGFMIFEKSHLPWHLTYDEIDYVVEGEFELRIDGMVHKGKAGDVMSIPKGSSVVFGSPSRAKVFYVTYPANWEEISK